MQLIFIYSHLNLCLLQLFRKDLISAMKLPDNEQLDESEFWDVSDAWKQEWERGVQVPVNSKNVPNPNVR